MCLPSAYFFEQSFNLCCINQVKLSANTDQKARFSIILKKSYPNLKFGMGFV